MTRMTRLEQIWIYPVKSLPGIRLKNAEIDERGFVLDRHWMLVEKESGKFVTQREFPKLSLINLVLNNDTISLSYKGSHVVSFQRGRNSGNGRLVQVWNDTVQALVVDPEIDLWFSDILQQQVSLVEIADDSFRQVDQRFANETDQTGFSDGFPFLLLGSASLDDLNKRITGDVQMTVERFRPNLVVGGSEPYAEDDWKKIKIGDVSFNVVKPCSRCSITTVDPSSAVMGKEPLLTLASYRRKGNQVYFGQNLIHQSKGHLSEGDVIEVLG